MKMKSYCFANCISLILVSVYLAGCSASTSDRFKNSSQEVEKKSTLTETNLIEDFDFTKYRPPFELQETKITTTKIHSAIWYEFENYQGNSGAEKIISGTASGFRVQVLSTDNLDEANQLRSDIYFSTDQKDVYVIFDPAFYKVQIGDFLNYSDAEKLAFKLKQLGYTEARSVNETINLFK